MNRNWLQTCILLTAGCTLLLAGISFPARPAQAQVRAGWTEPHRLSSDRGRSSEAYLATDQYGFVHAFWSEGLFTDQRSFIQYARFNGNTWTAPVDLYYTRPGFEIQSISPFVDANGLLHIVWSEGNSGPVYYSYAPLANALSAQQWSPPMRITIPAKEVKFLVDSQGVFHLLYNRIIGGARGVYYVQSTDQGATWSDPVWLDVDILGGFAASAMNFEMDDAEGLHVAWFYSGVETQGGDWVRYAHSLDGGNTWSEPFTIDKARENSDYKLTFAYPIMAVAGQRVHIVWAGGSLPYRHHRFSTDRGQTWSPKARIFGELHGQAFESLVADGEGRIHYFGQIRYPQGIYHTMWTDAGWSKPVLIYNLNFNAPTPAGGQVHAHYTLATVRAGNQFILTFTDSPPEPDRRLFVIHWTTDDFLPFALIPTPAPTAVATPTPTSKPLDSEPWATAPALSAAGTSPSGLDSPRPDLAIWLGVVPALLLLGLAFAYRFVVRVRL